MSEIRGQGRLGLVACAMLVVLACHAEEARPVVALRAEATVTGAEVLLGQIADIQAPAELAARLAAVSLGSAPVAGTPRRIEAGYIKLRLRRYGIDPAGVEMQGEAVTVRRAGSGPGLWQAQPLRESPSHEPGATDAPVLVRRGQLVEVVVQCRGVSIRAVGVAGRDGRLGDLIELRLEKTNHKLLGHVVGPGRASYTITAATDFAESAP